MTDGWSPADGTTVRRRTFTRGTGIGGPDERWFEGVCLTAEAFESVIAEKHAASPLSVSGVTVRNRTLSTSYWKTADLHRCHLQDFSFQDSRLLETDFWSCHLQRVDFTRCTLSGLGFLNCRIDHLTLDDCETDGLDFECCSIGSLDIRDTDSFRVPDQWSTVVHSCAVLDAVSEASLRCIGWHGRAAGGNA